jgi:hypothetical protein
MVHAMVRRARLIGALCYSKTLRRRKEAGDPRDSPESAGLVLTMNTHIAPLVASLALAVAGCARGPSASSDIWAITDVAVIDVIQGRVNADQTIVIKGDRIDAIVSSANANVPEGVSVVRAPGTFVIPGLFDMHVHLFSSPRNVTAELMRHLKDGVLGVRDMGMPLDSIPRLRAIADSPSTPVPRVWFSGPILEETDSHSINRIVVTDTGAARQVVETLAAAGVTSIKVHDLLSPELYGAVARAASSAGLPVVGHVPITMTTDQLIGGNQHSIEHLGQTGGLLASCSANGRIDRDLSDRLLRDPRYYQFFTGSAYLVPVLTTFDADRCADLARRLAQAEIWQVPTLVIWRAWSHGFPWGPPEDMVHVRELLPIALRITAMLNDAGAPIMAGTDNVGTIHDELELLVSAGLSRAEALRAATISPATFLGFADSIGAVAPDYTADLLILDGNPLDDIRNTRRIRSIIWRGRLLNPTELN